MLALLLLVMEQVMRITSIRRERDRKEKKKNLRCNSKNAMMMVFDGEYEIM